jgi:hypothetical protein
MCRRSYASLVGTAAVIERALIKIEKGEDQLIKYAQQPEVQRLFCGKCGCSLFYYWDKFPDKLFYYPATLDAGVHPGHPKDAEHHIYVGSKAEWDSFVNGLPKHTEGVGTDFYNQSKAE